MTGIDLTPELLEHLQRFAAEKESMVAKYLAETGLRPDQVVLVQRVDGAFTRWYVAPREPELDDVAPEVRRLKDLLALERGNLAAAKAELDRLHAELAERDDQVLAGKRLVDDLCKERRTFGDRIAALERVAELAEGELNAFDCAPADLAAAYGIRKELRAALRAAGYLEGKADG